jgi:peptide deformylase
MIPIRIYGDPVLRKTAGQVEVFDEALAKFVEEMIATMIEGDGVGLAANQVGDLRRVVVIDTTGGEQPSLVLINPVITGVSEEIEETDEGCLSLPGISLPVKRPAKVSVEAVDQYGKPFSIKDATGLLARALQHETDHLNGILFIDHVSALQRTMVSGKLKKLAKTGSVDR